MVVRLSLRRALPRESQPHREPRPEISEQPDEEGVIPQLLRGISVGAVETISSVKLTMAEAEAAQLRSKLDEVLKEKAALEEQLASPAPRPKSTNSQSWLNPATGIGSPKRTTIANGAALSAPQAPAKAEDAKPAGPTMLQRMEAIIGMDLDGDGVIGDPHSPDARLVGAPLE